MTLRQDLIIRQGETWSFVYTHLDAAAAAVDLTGYTARMAIRDGVGGILEAYLSTGSDAVNGTITLGDEAGTVTLSMTPNQTSAMADSLHSASILIAPEYREKPEETFLYDLELVSVAGVVTRALEGRVRVIRQITE